MRISDWSSDVCSSDLNKLCRIHATPVSAICLARGSPQLVCCCAAQNKRKKHECSSVSARINLPLTPATRESAETRLVQPYRVSLCTMQSRSGTGPGQIGRASCRERVCQYV